MDKNKYNRTAKDASQLQQFVNEACDELEAASVDAIKVTYSELKALRNEAKLIPGKMYRITDYDFTTAVVAIESAHHIFDIIVVAIDEHTLSEYAKAALHEGDTYFAKRHLESWQVWYCLDNDDIRFEWADNENGKGVIYRLIDDRQNDLPYDFKNLLSVSMISFKYSQWGKETMFYRDRSLDDNGYFGWRCASADIPIAWSNPYCFTSVEIPTTTMSLYSDTNGTAISYGGSILSVSITEGKAYTFNCKAPITLDILDASSTDIAYAYNNTIRPWLTDHSQRLNKIYFYAIPTGGNSGVYNNFFDSNCRDISFNNDVKNSIFNINCHSITSERIVDSVFGCNVQNCICGSVISSNIYNNCADITLYNVNAITLQSGCSSISLSDISELTIGADCSYITLKYASYVKIDANCSNITITGTQSSSNVSSISIGSKCEAISLLNSSRYINIGNDCSNIALGEDSQNITIGNNCDNIKMPVLASDVGTLTRGIQYITLECYISRFCISSDDFRGIFVSYVKVCQNIYGTANSPKVLYLERKTHYITVKSVNETTTTI